jgi:hypothetical protein
MGVGTAWALSVRRRAVTVTVSSWPLALSPLLAGAGVSAAWVGDQLVLPASNMAMGKDFNRLISGSGPENILQWIFLKVIYLCFYEHLLHKR